MGYLFRADLLPGRLGTPGSAALTDFTKEVEEEARCLCRLHTEEAGT